MNKPLIIKPIIIFGILCICGCLSVSFLLFSSSDDIICSNSSLKKSFVSLKSNQVNQSLTQYHHLSTLELSAIAVIVHGLNVNPQKMESIIALLVNMGIDVFSISLQGHGLNYSSSDDMDEKHARMNAFKTVSYEIWQNEFLRAYHFAKKESLEHNVPIYFVGFSIGGLLGVDLLASQSNVSFEKLILFAPALFVKLYCQPLKLLTCFPNLVIPSATPIDYRSNNGTPMAAYRVLFQTISHCSQFVSSKINIPTLIFIDKNDEFISYKGLNQFIKNHHLTHWKIVPIVNESQIQPIYHHLIIDSESVGQKTWKKMVALMNHHLKSVNLVNMSY